VSKQKAQLSKESARHSEKIPNCSCEHKAIKKMAKKNFII